MGRWLQRFISPCRHHRIKPYWRLKGLYRRVSLDMLQDTTRMVLARMCMRNFLLRRSPVLFYNTAGARGLEAGAIPAPRLCYSSSAAAGTGASSEGGTAEKHKETAVSERSSASPLASGRRSRRGRRWRDNWDLLPFHFNDGLSKALMQVSENLNRVLGRWAPSRVLRRIKDDDKCYRLRYEVPGLSKEDLRITVEEGILVITGERKEEEEGGSDDDDAAWYSRKYDYYNTSLLLPADAKVEDIKAEIKNGILYVTIPRSEDKKRDVRKVEIH